MSKAGLHSHYPHLGHKDIGRQRRLAIDVNHGLPSSQGTDSLNIHPHLLHLRFGWHLHSEMFRIIILFLSLSNYLHRFDELHHNIVGSSSTMRMKPKAAQTFEKRECWLHKQAASAYYHIGLQQGEVEYLESLRLDDSKHCTWVMQRGVHEAKYLPIGVREIGQDLPDEQLEGCGPAIHDACHHLQHQAWFSPVES